MANTQEKLARLEARYAALQTETVNDKELSEATLASLMRCINQFKEEIASHSAHKLAHQ